MTYMNHNEPYSDTYLQDILSSVKTIAMVVGQALTRRSSAMVFYGFCMKLATT